MNTLFSRRKNKTLTLKKIKGVIHSFYFSHSQIHSEGMPAQNLCLSFQLKSFKLEIQVIDG